MKKIFAPIVASLLLLALLPAHAAPKDPASSVKITNAWAKPTVPGAKVSAVYMRIEAKVPLKLLMAQSTAAEDVQIHDMRLTNGVMMMNPADIIELTPGKPLEMKPGGLHIMLTKVKKPIIAGEPVLVRLTFVGEDNKPFTTTVDARAQEKPAGK